MHTAQNPPHRDGRHAAQSSSLIHKDTPKHELLRKILQHIPRHNRLRVRGSHQRYRRFWS